MSQKLIFAIILFFLGTCLGNDCIPGWDRINGKCYRLIEATMKLDAAIEVCQTVGGKVFEPRYEMQENMVRAFYGDRIIWLGMTDRENEGSFTYVSTNTPVGYTNWDNDIGTITGGEDCVILNKTIWHDTDCQCADQAMVLCEEQTVSCPDEPGWKVISGRCFYISMKAEKYHKAEKDCYDKGGRLFEPRSAAANARIFAENSKQFWIGIHARDDPGNYVYTSTDEALTYEQWADKEPDQETKKSNCVLVKDKEGNWGDKHCGAKRSYVCERPYAFNPFWDFIALSKEDKVLVDYVYDNIFNVKTCNEKNGGNNGGDGGGGDPPTANEKRFLVFGGLGVDGTIDGVYRVDLNTGESCQHSQFPVSLKEAYAFEWNGTVLVCSSFTSVDMKNLQCWIWSALTGWESFATPEANGIFGFISAVKVPGVGLWFIDNNLNTLTLDETTGNWTEGYHWTNFRQRACAVTLTNTKVAHLGGTPAAVGQTIDTYDFATDIESLNVTQMLYDRKQFSCALIPQGAAGNPTVAILGDNSPPYPYVMELWDSVTETITTVPHPPGYETARFFRPSIITYDDNTLLFAAATVFDDSGEYHMQDMFLYRVGEGWISLGPSPDPLNLVDQSGLFLLDDPSLPVFNSLDRCAF